MARIPRLLLFDIDGTLTTSAHSGSQGGDSLLKALSISFGKNIERNNVHFSGGTDPSISDDVLKANGIDAGNCEGYQKKIDESFRILPQIVESGINDGRYCWKVLPNVNQLLDSLAKRVDVRLALLTGNLQATADLKLKCAGINTSLLKLPRADGSLFGAFGSDHGDRSELVRIARKRYADFLGHNDIKPNDMVVIGDSPKDIACAHANDVPCVAVTTGRYDKDALSQADAVLDGGFRDVQESIEVILKTCKTA